MSSYHIGQHSIIILLTNTFYAIRNIICDINFQQMILFFLHRFIIIVEEMTDPKFFSSVWFQMTFYCSCYLRSQFTNRLFHNLNVLITVSILSFFFVIVEKTRKEMKWNCEKRRIFILSYFFLSSDFKDCIFCIQICVSKVEYEFRL